jgi:Mor family transcriptional regulator
MSARKLTKEDVIEILSRHNDSEEELIKHYGISPVTLYKIFSNKTWKSIDRSSYPKRKDKRRKITEEQVFAIRAENSPNIKELALKYNLKESYILQLRDKNKINTWKTIPHTSTVSHKLSEKQVAEIKAMKVYIKRNGKGTVNRSFIAKHYGITEQTVTSIMRNRRWKHVEPAKNIPFYIIKR